MSNLCWPNSAPQLPQFMGHPILVLRKQTCACPASGMSKRLTTPFIPGQISSREIFHPELIWLFYLYGRRHIMMNEYPLYFSWKNKLVHAPHVGWAWGWPHLSSQHILSRTDKLFVYFYFYREWPKVCFSLYAETETETETGKTSGLSRQNTEIESTNIRKNSKFFFVLFLFFKMAWVS